MPYVVIEAIAAEKPLVATNVGGIPEIFGGYSGRLVPAGDAARLAEAMAEMRRFPDVAGEFAGKLSHHIRREFTVEAMAKGVERVYRLATA
jgi:glycosyltransferase involved in cell wall biosynthesis